MEKHGETLPEENKTSVIQTSRSMALICTGMHRASEGPNPESFRKAPARYGGARQGCGPNEGIGGSLTIDRFAHQSGRGERFGGLSTAKIHDVSARLFLDRSQKS